MNPDANVGTREVVRDGWTTRTDGNGNLPVDAIQLHYLIAILGELRELNGWLRNLGTRSTSQLVDMALTELRLRQRARRKPRRPRVAAKEEVKDR